MKSFIEYLEEHDKRRPDEEIFGWLSPGGKFYSCGMFDHAIVALNKPELKKYISKQTLEAVDKQVYGNEADREISNDLYKAGCLRVGSNPADLNSDVIFEGISEAVKNLYQKAKDIAEQYGRKASFHIRKLK